MAPADRVTAASMVGGGRSDHYRPALVPKRGLLCECRRYHSVCLLRGASLEASRRAGAGEEGRNGPGGPAGWVRGARGTGRGCARRQAKTPASVPVNSGLADGRPRSARGLVGQGWAGGRRRRVRQERHRERTRRTTWACFPGPNSNSRRRERRATGHGPRPRARAHGRMCAW